MESQVMERLREFSSSSDMDSTDTEDNEVQEPVSGVPGKPVEFCEIETALLAPFSPEVVDWYFKPFFNESTRSDPRCPEIRIVSLTNISRMKQLVGFFPDGVCDEYFIETYEKILGNVPALNGYTFPKDNDRRTSFHLPSVFWIPDNDVYHLPKRLVFPVESSKKYNGSLQPLLEAYWNQFLEYMKGRTEVHLNEEFDEDNEEYFHAITGIWFSYKRWGLLTYVQFFELLLENFDHENKLYTILFLPSEEPGCLRQRIILVISGEDGEFAREYERQALEKFSGIEKVVIKQKEEPQLIREQTRWIVDKMNFATVEELQKEPYESRVFNVVAAGNIQDFYLFNVLLVKDIPKRDRQLKTIHNLVCETTNFTVPDSIVEKCVVIFLNAKFVWRRGVILHHNKTHDLVKVLDIDTGETKTQIPVNLLRNITSTLFNLPVLTVPVRFSVHPRIQNYFIGNAEGNRVLGKYLHMMLIEANKGLRLRFFRWDSEYTHYLPGVWVVKGFLIDIIRKVTIFPRVSISDYLLEKFKNRRQDEILPEWPEDVDDDDDFGILIMRERHSDITYAMDYFSTIGADHLRDFSWNKNSPKLPTGMEVDKERKDEPVATIFQDDEFRGCQVPLEFCAKTNGLRGLFKTNVVLENSGEKKQPKEEIKKERLCRLAELTFSRGEKAFKIKNPIKLTVKINNLGTIHQEIIIDHSKLSSHDKIALEYARRKHLIMFPATVITE